MVTFSVLFEHFKKYPAHEAPFMHQQREHFANTKPFSSLRVLHHVPLVSNTLLKIACLVEAGADITVTNPSFMIPDAQAIQVLNQAGINYVHDLTSLNSDDFDIFFDCGAELFQQLGSPRIGAIELTGSGDQFYRQQLNLNFPVISIDRTATKQLETVFGCAESCQSAIALLSGKNPRTQPWVIFGFGKIGRGLAYFCQQNQTPVIIVEPDWIARQAAQTLGLQAVDPTDYLTLQAALREAEIIVTATGKKAILDPYPLEWFQGKTLANMGIYDEYGARFATETVLNKKQPVNFILKDPTPMKYIDPEFYLHNQAACYLASSLQPGVHPIPLELDQQILQQWCHHHAFSAARIEQWIKK